MTNYKYYIYYLINTISPRSILITLLVLLFHFSFAQNQSEIQLANEYLLKGDKKKAVELYRELSKQDVNNSFIYNNYINTLLDLGAYDEAQGFLKKLLKRDPQNLQYKLDAGLVYVRSGDLTRADRYFRELIAENKTNVQRIKLMADLFTSRSFLH